MLLHVLRLSKRRRIEQLTEETILNQISVVFKTNRIQLKFISKYKNIKWGLYFVQLLLKLELQLKSNTMNSSLSSELGSDWFRFLSLNSTWIDSKIKLFSNHIWASLFLVYRFWTNLNFDFKDLRQCSFGLYFGLVRIKFNFILAKRLFSTQGLWILKLSLVNF